MAKITTPAIPPPSSPELELSDDVWLVTWLTFSVPVILDEVDPVV